MRRGGKNGVRVRDDGNGNGGGINARTVTASGIDDG